MPTVPEYKFNRQLKQLYLPADAGAPATLKQRSLILTLHERRKLQPPDLSKLTKGQAAVLISRMLHKEKEEEQ
jgi:hypothetical protein